MRRCYLCALLSVCALPALAQWEPTLVANGSFELDLNRDREPDGWAAAPFDSPAKFTWDDQVAHAGRRSLRLSDSKSRTNRDWRANTARWTTTASRPALGGETYSLRGWLRTELTEGEATIVFAWFGGNKWLHEDATQKLRGKQDWTAVSSTVKAPAAADTLRVYLMLNNGVGSAWFDDIEAVAGPAFPSNYRPVDLRAACTAGFRDDTAGDGQGGWTDQGANDARNITLGRQVWRGLPFEVIDPAANGGRSAVVLRPGQPRTAEVKVEQRCDVLYLLHAVAYAGRNKAAVRYTVRYADGTTASVTCRAGAEIGDWWRPEDTPLCAVGWEGSNAECDRIGLLIFPWRNPKPAVAIASLSMEALDQAMPLLVAVTAGDGPPVLEERPVRLEFTDTTGWYPWTFSLDDPLLQELDLSRLLDAPAGRHGFAQVGPDGHLVFADGTRTRFFGTNVGGSGCCPDKALADKLADKFAHYGLNLLRLHAPDSTWGGIIDYSKGGTREFNADALDRYDYFVAALLKRGIYVYFDLLDYRSFKPADGVRDADQMGTQWEHSLKGASIFDERMIELQQEYATMLLTHRNPYTGRRYVDEPGLLIQEITNENNLFYLGNPKLMLPSYVADLTRRWNAWLVQQYQSRAALDRAWAGALAAAEDPAQGTVHLPLSLLYADLSKGASVGDRSPLRLSAMTRFLFELQLAYYKSMVAHLRSIGLKCPITGTNQDFSDASNAANAACDAMTRNNYWCHPNFSAKPFFRFSNAAVVNSDLCRTPNPITDIASSTVAGKPMIVPEFNFPWPNEWRAECLPLMAAYGRLQDWDGMLYFAAGNVNRPALDSFGNWTDPVRWGQVPLAALIFERGDIDAARTSVDIGVSRSDLFAVGPQRGREAHSPYRVLPYLSKVRNAYFDQVYDGHADVVISSGHSTGGDYTKANRAIVLPPAELRPKDTAWLHQLWLAAAKRWDLPGQAPPDEAGRIFRADTGQLVLDRERGLFTAVAPRVRMAMGFLGKLGEIDLGGVKVTCRTPFASISVVSLDGQPIEQSQRLLLTAVARAENTGQAFHDNHRALAEVGKAPVLAEPVDAQVTLPTGLRAWALGPRGEKLRELPAANTAGPTSLALVAAKTPWVLLTK